MGRPVSSQPAQCTGQETVPEPHDAHVTAAHKVFRDCGFTLAAMQFPRPPEALSGLKHFNRVADDWKHPFAWNYFPNAYMRDNWRKYYA
jgi:hypothetical protein